MMYKNRSEHSHRRQYSDGSSRQWDDYDDRWEERHGLHRDAPQECYHKYDRDEHRNSEKKSRSREYSDSPKRLYSNNSLNRDRSRKSPVRRSMSSSDWGSSEKQRRRFTEDDEDHYRYRLETEDNSNRISPDNFSRSHITKDFKHSQPQEEDFRYKRATQDSRHKYRHEDFTFRQQQDELTCSPSSGYHKDRDGHEKRRDRSHERRRSQDYSTRSFESDVSYQTAAGPEQKKQTKGFQRFLDVLNKGVNVDTLTKIVSQNSEGFEDQPQSPISFMNPADHSWSPSFADLQKRSNKTNRVWSESEGHHRSLSPKRNSLSDERALLRGDGERGCLKSRSRSRSPLVVEKKPLMPEDDHKHRQMLDVLQAIGMNLGFEELGQMSHRIQERLYGKRDNEREHPRRGGRERDTRRAYSPRMQSRSSSSRSSFSPPAQEYYLKKEADDDQRDVAEVQQMQILQSVEYDKNCSGNTLQEIEKCDKNSQERTAACQAYGQSNAYTLPEPSSPPVMSVYSPVNCSPLPYTSLPPALPPALRPALPLSLPSALPPTLPPYLPNVGPRFLLSHRPPLLHVSGVPPLNLFPALLPQTRHLFPQPISNPQPPLFNLPHMNPIQPMNNTQNKKTQSRPRCLQVIETKQPG